METLSSTLLAAQQSRSAVPYVKAVLQDYDGGAPRLRLSRVYTGAEAAGPAAVVVASDGSLVRARRDGSTVYVSTIGSPAASSTFSSWQSLGAISSTGSTLALARAGSTLYLFYVHTDNTGLRVRTSADNGATWSSATSIATASGTVSALAADANPFTSDVVLFYNVGAAVFTTRFTGSWSTPAEWDFTAALGTVSGLAVTWNFDFQVVVTGTEDTTLVQAVWTAVFGDDSSVTLGDWSSELVVFQAAANATGLSFDGPAIEVLGSAYRLTYAESYLGDESYIRVMQSWQLVLQDLQADRWREPWPMDYAPSTDEGVAAAVGGSNLWLVAAAGVWLATLGDVADLDVSALVVDARADHEEYRGDVVVELDNADGALTSAEAVARGMRLQLQPGYATSAGNEVSGTARYYWVESVEWVTGPRPRVVLRGRNGWGRLDRWHARRQYSWAAGETNMFEAMHVVLSRVGLRGNASAASSTITTWEPRLTINPGEDGLSLFRRLLGSVADVARFEGVIQDVLEPDAGDSVDYAYGDGDHDILAAHYRDDGPAENWVRVQGSGYFAEAFDLADVEAVGERATPPIVDLNLTTEVLTTGRADLEIRERLLRSRRDTVCIFGVNCGQELYDIVEITDPAMGFSDEGRRVVGLRWWYEQMPRPKYAMELTLTVP